MGGWIGQMGADGTERVVAYWSRRLSPAERNYPTHEKEFLALFSVITRFRTYLFGHSFLALVDHRALEHLHEQPTLRPRQIRWLMQLQEFDFTVEYVKGEWNTFADWLSRRPDFAAHVCEQCQQAVSVSAIHHDSAPFLDLLLEKQQLDEFIQQLESWKTDAASIPHRQRGYFKSFVRLENGLWTYKNALVIPDKETQVYFLKKAHCDGGHMGILKSLYALKQLAYWPEMQRDLEAFIAACDTCQRCNQPQQSVGLLQSLRIPDYRGQMIHMDFAAMPLDDGGQDYLLIITDRFSKFIVTVPCRSSITAKQTAECVFKNWYLSGFGFPESITTDRDSLFTSAMWAEFIALTGVKHTMTTARHQQANGQAEAAVKIVKNGLRKLVQYGQTNWADKLPLVTFAHNNSLNAATGFTPFYLMNAFTPATLPSILPAPSSTLASSFNKYFRDIDKAHSAMIQKQAASQRAYDRSHHPAPTYKIGDPVLLSRDGVQLDVDSEVSHKLLSRWIGPFEISALDDQDNVTLDLPPNMKCWPVFHVSKIKPYTPPVFDIPSEPGAVDAAANIYEAEAILDTRVRRGKMEYLVKWKGYHDRHNTWEKEENVQDCGELLGVLAEARSNRR